MIIEDQLMVNQLLGRIVYFHCLFIEAHSRRPSRSTATRRSECCHHRSKPGTTPRPNPKTPDATAWTALLEVADAVLEEPLSSARVRACCGACLVLTAGCAIADRWIAVEHAAYGRAALAADTQQQWARVAGVGLAAAFAKQHPTRCAVLDQLRGAAPSVDLPTPDEFPLTAELLAVWADPAVSRGSPVVSWLNHCSELAEVGRVIQSRRTAA
jgi:hypothetical protein